MKTDGRKLDRATQAHLRRQVVLAVRGGMTQAEAARVHGLSLRAVQKACARAREGTLRALKGDARGRPAGHTLLSAAQQTKVRRIIVGKPPDQLKLPFYLWTRQAVAALIQRECGVEPSPTTVGRYLEDWGMTAQRPVRLILLPGYCPELNHDELLNQDVKTNALGMSRPANKGEMIKSVRRHLHRRQKQPAVIRNLFKEKHVLYAA